MNCMHANLITVVRLQKKQFVLLHLLLQLSVCNTLDWIESSKIFAFLKSYVKTIVPGFIFHAHTAQTGCCILSQAWEGCWKVPEKKWLTQILLLKSLQPEEHYAVWSIASSKTTFHSANKTRCMQTRALFYGKGSNDNISKETKNEVTD